MIKGQKLLAVVVLSGLVLAACAKPSAAPTPTPTPTPTRVSTPTPTLAPSPTPTAIVRTPTPTTAPIPTPTSVSTSTATPTPTKVTPTTAPTAPTAAQDLFLANCSACHGAKRQGVSNLGPALTPASLASLSDADVKKTIGNGRPGTLMPPWKDTLSEAEIDALVKLLKYAEP